jgi:linoleate 10R-lipoxygenase
MLTKLLFRTLPEYYPAGSAYAHFPFLDPAYMRPHMESTEHGREISKKYVWSRPTLPAAGDVVVISTPDGVRQVLSDQQQFPSGYAARLHAVTGRRDVDHAFVRVHHFYY